MFNVDTMSLVINFRKCIYINGEIKVKDKIKLYIIDGKIKRRLYCDTVYTSEGVIISNGKGNYDGYFFYYNMNWKSLTVMLPNEKVEEFTTNEILSNVKNAIMCYFELTEEEMEPIRLSRIDIKCDYLCQNDDMIIIKNILSKTKSHFRSYDKAVKMDSNKGYVLTYSSRINRNNLEYDFDRYTFKNFKIYRNFKFGNKNSNNNNSDNNELEDDEDDEGNYIEICFYDKGAETVYKVSRGNATRTKEKKFTNIFRSEVRIKNGRLNSNVFEHKNMTKELGTYYNQKTTSELYHKYIKSILGKNDFYRIDEAIRIISSSNYTKSKKSKLVDFIVDINRKGYSKAEDDFLNRRSKTTWYAYIREVEALGLNIITFDVVIDGKNVTSKYIRNFGQLKNDVKNELL